MSNASSPANTETGHTFDLWLNQWKLATLDSQSAKSMLTVVLDSMLANPGQHAFWQYLQEFLDESTRSSSEAAGTSATLAENTDALHPALVLRAKSLSSLRSKRLLEHLSRSYSLHGEAAVFWRIVAHVLKSDAMQSPQHGVIRISGSVTQ